MYRTPQKTRPSRQVDQTTASRADKKCVCVICTCGKHSCPKEPRHANPGHFDTTHNTDYKPWKGARPAQHPLSQSYIEQHYDPNDLKSSYKNDYTPQKLPLQQPKVQEKYIKVNQPFQADSEYKQRYVKQTQQKYARFPITRPQNPQNQQPYHHVSGGFNGNSTYKEEYIPHPLPKQEQPKKTENYFPPSGETGTSTYKQEYLKYDVSPNRPVPKAYQYHQTPMTEKESMYKTQYKQFDPKAYQREICPVEVLPQRPAHNSPGKQHLTYVADQNTWD